MKKLTFFLPVCAMALLAGCDSSAPTYNDALMSGLNICLDAVDTLEGVPSGDEIEDTIASCRTSRDVLSALEAFDDSTTFRDATIHFVDKQIESLEVLQDFVTNFDSLSETDQWTAMEQFTVLDQEVESAYNTITSEQEAFAEKYNLTLE